MLRSIGISTYKLTAVLLALALAFGAPALAEETPRPGAIADSPLEDDGVVRVLLRSLGAPFMAPVAPFRPHNPDILLRLPMWMQKRLLFLARKDSWMRKEDGE